MCQAQKWPDFDLMWYDIYMVRDQNYSILLLLLDIMYSRCLLFQIIYVICMLEAQRVNYRVIGPKYSIKINYFSYKNLYLCPYCYHIHHQHIRRVCQAQKWPNFVLMWYDIYLDRDQNYLTLLVLSVLFETINVIDWSPESD